MKSKEKEQRSEIEDTADWAEDLASYAAENKGRIKKEKLGFQSVIHKEPRRKLWRDANGVEAPENVVDELFNYHVLDRDGVVLLTIQSSKNIKTFFHKKRVDKPTTL